MTKKVVRKPTAKNDATARQSAAKNAKARPRRTIAASAAKATPRLRHRSAESLFERIASILEQARTRVARAANSEMVLAYGHIGREIVEHVQGGEARADYGQQVIDDLSERLTGRFGRGFSTTNLRYFRAFFIAYAVRRPEIRHIAGGESSTAQTDEVPRPAAREIRHTQRGVLDDLALASSTSAQPRGFSPGLGWSHYRALSSPRQCFRVRWTPSPTLRLSAGKAPWRGEAFRCDR